MEVVSRPFSFILDKNHSYIKITTEGSKIVCDKTSSDNVTTSVHCTSAKRDLEKVRQLIELVSRGEWMDESSLVVNDHICSNEGVSSDGGSENFDSEGVLDNFFGFLADIGVNERVVIIADDDISQSRELLVDDFNFDILREGVSDVLLFDISDIIWKEETIFVS